MDLSIYESSELDKILAIAEIDGLNKNKNDNIVTIGIFTGGSDARQKDDVINAAGVVESFFQDLGIEIRYSIFDNETVFNKKHWTPSDLINFLLEHDIHLIPTHGHQGNIARGNDINRLMWTANEYVDKLQLLQYHLGYPNGRYLFCPVYLQDKFMYLTHLQKYCTPSLSIEIPQERPFTPNDDDTNTILKFAEKYGPYCDNKFIGEHHK